ncbi:MAG: outer membrane protein assembly factor BamD [Pirellulales bacterium]
MQSYLNAYQGPQYDPTPLNKAEKLADHTLKNYAQAMPEERPRLYQAQEAIRAQVAEREYDLAEYYRRLDYNRAARAHYANVLKDYPDTKFAELAKQRMTEIENLPGEPPDHFPWLTKWLAREKISYREQP